MIFFAKRPALALIMSFGAAIAIGTFLLLLPASTPESSGISFIDALFTATSATCVTGLIVRSTASGFTLFGKTVILMLIQLGGLGLMTFSVSLFLTFGKKISKTQEVLLRDALNEDSIRSAREILNFLLLFTFGAEILGAGFLFFSFRQFYSAGEALKMAVFHSVSAFCNAGFSLIDSSISLFAASPGAIMIFSLLIILGGIGFVVLLDMFNRLSGKKKRFKIHTRLAVGVTAALLLCGTLFFYAGERNNTLKSMANGEKWLNAFFLSVTARTAGFNSVDTSALKPFSKFTAAALMFVGASPGGTGGGVKTVTFAIILLMAINHIRQHGEINVGGRTIPPFFERRATAIIVYAVFIIISACGILLYTETFPFEDIIFEVISAFGTVGLSAGVTPQLGKISKCVLIAVMFMGRLGPLTIALAAVRQKRRLDISYANERVLLG
ncbi:MAG: potassium transporter TrkG [Elusimicrobiota bacterium]|nr:potassium transporter TrkG [Elusimicrobiota bacterium]